MTNHKWIHKNLLKYTDSKGLVQTLDETVNQASGHILNLLEWLDTVPTNTDVIITIGSGGEKDSWQTEVKFSEARNTLNINIDPVYQETKFYPDTNNKKFIPLKFNQDISEIIEPLLKKILADKQNNVVFCDFRSPLFKTDCSSILCKHITNYRNPTNNQGNLIFLHGYFQFCPVFWPMQETVLSEHEKATALQGSCQGEYAEVFSKMHLSPERGNTATKSYEMFFEKQPVQNCNEKGFCFLYTKLGNLTAIQEAVEKTIKESVSSLPEEASAKTEIKPSV